MALVIIIIAMSIVFALDFFIVLEEKSKKERSLYCILMVASFVVLALRCFDVDLPSFTKHIMHLFSFVQ